MKPSSLLLIAVLSSLASCASAVSAEADEMNEGDDEVIEADLQSAALARTVSGRIIKSKEKLCIGVDQASKDNGAYIKQFTCGDKYTSNPNNQHWDFVELSDQDPDAPVFKIVNEKSGKCIGLDNGKQQPDTPLRQFKCDGKVNQRWTFNNKQLKPFNPDRSVTRLCVGADQGKKDSNVQLKVFGCSAGAPNQTWQLDLL